MHCSQSAHPDRDKRSQVAEAHRRCAARRYPWRVGFVLSLCGTLIGGVLVHLWTATRKG